MLPVATTNGSVAPHSASPPYAQEFETLCSVGSLAASSIAISMPTSVPLQPAFARPVFGGGVVAHSEA